MGSWWNGWHLNTFKNYNKANTSEVNWKEKKTDSHISSGFQFEYLFNMRLTWEIKFFTIVATKILHKIIDVNHNISVNRIDVGIVGYIQSNDFHLRFRYMSSKDGLNNRSTYQRLNENI